MSLLFSGDKQEIDGIICGWHPEMEKMLTFNDVWGLFLPIPCGEFFP